MAPFLDPLSALRQFATPALRGTNAADPAGPAAAVRTIPLAELQRVTPGATSTPAGGNFEQVLGGLVQDVTGRQAAAGDAVKGLLGGQNVSLHQAMIAMEEASVSFQLMVEVRNKLLESYQELMRMQI